MFTYRIGYMESTSSPSYDDEILIQVKPVKHKINVKV